MIPKTRHSFFAWILVAFCAGAGAYAFVGSFTPDAQRSDTLGKNRNGSPAADDLHALRPEESDRQLRRSVPSKPPGAIVLQLEVVDAILAGGGEQKIFNRMGLTADDLKRVAEIRVERVKELKRLEASHAKVGSDARGEFVAVEAFPEERRLWLDGMEQDLRKQLGDDRATVIARMISASDNDEDVGVYRRELHIKSSNNEGGKYLIEEKSFNPEGKHIDSDYEQVDDQSNSRWGHLLDFDEKN